MIGPLPDAFAVASRAAHDMLGSPDVAAQWDLPSALESMSVGDLCGHMLGVVDRFERTLNQDAPPDGALLEAASFYGANRVDRPGDLDGGLHPFIRQDGADRGQLGPAGVAGEFAAVTRAWRSAWRGSRGTAGWPSCKGPERPPRCPSTSPLGLWSCVSIPTT